jgi:response regulator RpfG family c-di-GMP phosphodiesterase
MTPPPTVPPMTPTRPRVLCVDDEPQVLEGLTLTLRRRFEVSTATSGFEGLALLDKASGPFAVVLSDMRMPVMNGATFLAQVRQRWPDTVRMLLTGQSEVEAAIAAVNEGQIFRFLSKPCPADQLIAAVTAASAQHDLVTAERVLLEQTLRGSIKTLTDILSLQSPLAFGRATRAKEHVAGLAEALGVKERWPLEVAAMLFPIGTIAVPPDTLEKHYEGRPLTPAETDMVERIPAVTEQLLANIPRLEPVREILAHHQARFDGQGGGRLRGRELPLGSRMLKLVVDYDVLETQGIPPATALVTLGERTGAYDPELLAAFSALVGARQQVEVIRDLTLAALKPGMVFVDDVRSRTGALLIGRGHEITPSLLERIRNFSQNLGVREPLRVSVPATSLGARPG